jgi:Fic family protein
LAQRNINWLIFFLDGLLTLTQRLTEKRQSYLSLKDYLNERQKEVLETLKQNSPAQIADINQLLPHIPRATLKRDLGILVERQSLTLVGKGRGVRYFTFQK